VITVIGPNPATDLILEVPAFAAGGVWRTRSALHLPGGKPVNVARTLRRLGRAARLVCPLGPGQEVESCCWELGIELRALPISQPTRTCVIVADPETGTSTVVNEPGPELTPGEAEEYRRLVLDNLASATLVLGSGSLPRGMPGDLYAAVALACREAGVPFILDASGETLQTALEAGPSGIKVNEAELKAAAGAGTLDDAVGHARSRGVEHVVVTLGPDGGLYLGPEGKFRVSAPHIRAVNPTGSGDAFLGSLAAGLERRLPWTEALRLAVSAGSLTASRLEPDIGPDPDLQVLMDQIAVTPEP
jgi:1-phosphofructokinase family hexose kinase